MAAISHVFTIRRAAQILGRDEDLLWELSDQLEPEDGKLWVCDIDGAETPRLHPRWHRGSSRNYQGSDRSRRLISRRVYRGAQRMLTSSLLDAPMLSQNTNRARRGSHKRPGPPVYSLCVGGSEQDPVPRALGAKLLPPATVHGGPSPQIPAFLLWADARASITSSASSAQPWLSSKCVTSLSPTQQTAFGGTVTCLNLQVIDLPSNKFRRAINARCPHAHRAPSAVVQILSRRTSTAP